jgi:insulysin
MSCSIFEGTILTSAIDKREYRHLTLSNELQCLLVSDPETEKSSACCDVRVGSLCDPADAQGLAHFLEHMLFMGTEKYPVENAYSSFLNSHGGFSNAYTDQENTVYYFDVQNDFMEGALDMFASFFTCPILSDSATTREMNAVDSENTKNLQVSLYGINKIVQFGTNLLSLFFCIHVY